MEKGKKKVGWYILMAVSVVVFLTAAGLFSYVVLFGGGNAAQPVNTESDLQKEQPTGVSEQNDRAITPVLRSFGGDIEWYDGGKWVSLESVTELEEGDPLAEALKNYKEQTDRNKDDGETQTETQPVSVKSGKVAEQKSASGASTPQKQPEQTNTPPSGSGPAAPQPPVVPQPPVDPGQQESNPYL